MCVCEPSDTSPGVRRCRRHHLNMPRNVQVANSSKARARPGSAGPGPGSDAGRAEPAASGSETPAASVPAAPKPARNAPATPCMAHMRTARPAPCCTACAWPSHALAVAWHGWSMALAIAKRHLCALSTTASCIARRDPAGSARHRSPHPCACASGASQRDRVFFPTPSLTRGGLLRLRAGRLFARLRFQEVLRCEDAKGASPLRPV